MLYPMPMRTKTHTSLRANVIQSLQEYFIRLDGHEPVNCYEMVLSEVEQPLLQTVMEYAEWNQCRAAKILGLNRGTLRKKLKKYGIKRGAS